MRVSTAFNKMLMIPGAWVASVSFEPKAVIVGLRRRHRRLRCACGFSTMSRYDASVRRWRHLDLGACALYLEAEVRRLVCPHCGVRTETVAWARPRARHTRDFEDVVAWLAQRTDKTTVARLLRCSWQAVDAIVGRVVADHLDDARLNDLFRIGVDEISYKRGPQPGIGHYVTVVADHDSGHVVWMGEGRGKQVLMGFFDELGPQRCAQLQAVSMDLGHAYRRAAEDGVPHARICFDPFHVIRMANAALDAVFKNASSEDRLGLQGKGWYRLRAALRTGAEHLKPRQLEVLAQVRRLRGAIVRAWELKEALRDLYRIVDPASARDYLRRWCRRAARSRIAPFVILARRIRANLEGINAKIRLINRRGYGHHTAAALIGMAYLCCGGISVRLPTER